MNSITFSSFSNEITKIAFLEKAANILIDALKDGWHGTKDNPQHWMGRGVQMGPVRSATGSIVGGAENFKPIGRFGRMGQRISSLGGLTKYLPVGGKALTALPLALGAREALAKQDPTGRERGRLERATGLVGNTVGGLMGSALAMKAVPKSGILAPMLGGIAGGIVGEKAVSLPFRKAQAQAPQQPQQVVPYTGVPQNVY